MIDYIWNMLRFHEGDINPFLNKLPKSSKNRAMEKEMICWFIMTTSSHTQLRVVWNNVTHNQVIISRPPIAKKTPHAYRDLQRSTFMPNICRRCITVVYLLPRKHLIHTTNCIPISHIGPPQPNICNIILQRNISKQSSTLLN